MFRSLVALAFVLVASTASAQGGMGGPPPGGMGQGGPGGMGGGRGGMMARQNEILFKDITLTDAQKAKIDSIQAKGREEMMAMMQGGGMQDPGMREQMVQMRTKQAADVRAVLTPAQQAVYDKNVDESRRNGPGGPGGPGGRRPPQH